MICYMTDDIQQAVAGRLAAIMDELGKNRREMAAFLDVGESRLGNWLGKGAKSNRPAEDAMVRLVKQVPALTMDYIYLGRLDAVPMALAIRLKAREMGIDPNQPGQEEAVAAALATSNRKV